MPALDYFVIIVFALLIVWVGMSFKRSGSNMKSYFAAGGALPWWISGLSLFMSFFSAGTFVVWGSIAYEYGWVAITIQWMMGIGGFIIALFIAPRWHQAQILTVGEYIGQKFGSGLRQFYSYIFLVLSFITTGAFLYPVAKLFNVSTGFSIEFSIVLIGLLVISYTATGGLWAVVITDVLQFIILFAAVILVVPLALKEVGGFEDFIATAPTDFFAFTGGPYTGLFLFAFLMYNTLFIGGNWAYVQRYTSVKSAREARKVGFLFAGLYLISPILWMIPAMVFKVTGHDLSGLENEGAFLLMCKRVLPNGLLGLMLGGMIFATASSVNTTLNTSAAVFTHDIYERLRKGVSTSNRMMVARISTVVFGLFTIGVALAVPSAGGIVEVVISFGALTGAPLFAPPIWSLFSQRQTARSMIFTTVISLLINLYFKFGHPIFFEVSLDRGQEMMLGVLCPLAILLAFEVRLLPSGKGWTEKAHMVIDHSLDSSENDFAKRILGQAVLLTGILVIFLAIISDHSKLWVASIGFLIGTIGVGILKFRPNSN